MFITTNERHNTYTVHIYEVTRVFLIIFNADKTIFIVNEIVFDRLIQTKIIGIFFELAKL